MKSILLIILTSFSVICCAQKEKKEAGKTLHILVFSKTEGYRHSSISAGVKMLYDQSNKQNWLITSTEDASLINATFLKNIDVAIFLNPSGSILSPKQQKAFREFIENGKGFVGIHAATDCEFEWKFYGDLVGAYFRTHPPAQKATIIIEDTSHPAMEPFQGMQTYTTVDEWYSFNKNPRENVNVLASLDEGSIHKQKDDSWRMGDHPLIWWTKKGSARSFYTVFGHTRESFQNELIIQHITNAINWAGKRID